MKKLLIIAGILIVIGGIIFLVRQRQQKTTKESSATVQRGTLTVSLTLSGEIQAKERYAARFQTTGMVTGVYAKEGDTVKKYQTLAILDQRRLKNEMEQLLKQYMNTRWTFEQTNDDQKTTAELAPQQAVRERAKRLIDQAQFSLDRSVLAVEAQALALEFSVLKSPIDGIVAQAPKLTAGMNITIPSQAEFDIINPNSLYFEVLADQTEVTLLKETDTARITLDAYQDTTISGVIRRVGFIPRAGEIGTVYPVEIAFQEFNPSYRLGMTGDATFVTQEKQNTLIVPISFVTTKNGKKYVTVKNNGKFEDVEVTTGLENDTEIEILSGVSEGTVVYD